MILVLLTVAAVGIFAAGLLVGRYADDRRTRVPEHPAMRPYDWQREEGA